MSICLGDTELSSVALGDTELAGLYLGETEIWTPGGGLPSEYQQVEYLQSTGSQYIDTGYTFDKPLWRIEADCVFDNVNNNHMFGMYYGYEPNVVVYGGVYQGNNTNYQIVNSTIPAGTRVTAIIDITDKSISINSATDSFYHEYAGDFGPTSSVYKFVLFACWSTWTNALWGYGQGKIYRIKWFSDDDLVFDFVPCYRKLDNKPGMYDMVSGTFKTNVGTGEFICGPDV